MPRPIALLLLALTSCAPPIEDQIERLKVGGEELVRAKQELLLARERAVPPLLAALDDPRQTANRLEIVEVLAALMLRLNDENITRALQRHLLANPDSLIRARIGYEVGLYNRTEFTGAFTESLQDTVSEVRGRAMAALRKMDHKLSNAQKDSLIEAARLTRNDDHWLEQLEARAVVDKRVSEWVGEANNYKLKGQITEAEAIYHEALTFAPRNRQASLALGLLYSENGEEKKGLQVLREAGWLVDVPHVNEGPKIDGRLDDDIWRQAGRIGPLINHPTYTLESDHPTQLLVLYTDESLYLGAHCADAHPDSLVVADLDRDSEDHQRQDLVEIFLDWDLDHKGIVRITINSAGAISDAILNWEVKEWDYSRSVRSEAAGHVGDDFWSIEYRLEFGQPEIPIPQKGDRWGVDNIQREYRKSVEQSSWTRDYPDVIGKTYGWFLFQ